MSLKTYEVTYPTAAVGVVLKDAVPAGGRSASIGPAYQEEEIQSNANRYSRLFLDLVPPTGLNFLRQPEVEVMRVEEGFQLLHATLAAD